MGGRKKGKITRKQKKMLLEYAKCGEVTAAARAAKMSCAYAIRLVRKPHVQQYLREIEEKIDSEKIMDARQRREWWSDVMRNEKVLMKDRLKASELLARVCGDFVERVHHTASGFQLRIDLSALPGRPEPLVIAPATPLPDPGGSDGGD